MNNLVLWYTDAVNVVLKQYRYCGWNKNSSWLLSFRFLYNFRFDSLGSVSRRLSLMSGGARVIVWSKEIHLQLRQPSRHILLPNVSLSGDFPNVRLLA
jgi:hypothetical protein